jgi:hypothetical protein
MKKQTYTEAELYDKIYWIENNYNKMIQYNIIIENDTEKEVIEFIKQNISGYYTTDYDMDTYDIKVIYNNILIVVDIERGGLYLYCNKNDTANLNTNIDTIIDSLSFLHPKYYDEEYERHKIKMFLAEENERKEKCAEEIREAEITRRENKATNKKENIYMTWQEYVRTNKNNPK